MTVEKEPGPWVKAPGARPVHKDTLVDVKFRDDRYLYSACADSLDWIQKGGSSDVLRYRLSAKTRSMPKPVVEEHEKTLDQRFDEFAKETAGSFTQIVTTLLDIQSALPSPPHLKLNIANCCQCGRVVDTREKIDGGDDWGHQLSDKRWVCSPEFLAAAAGGGR